METEFPRGTKLVHPASKNMLASGLGPQIDLGARQAPTCFWVSEQYH